ncbi:MAG: aryl-sulfate sulfotransferase, partial [candidate division KSB1 bacterium]|nr:aryl-sulfate sulfotransferase [candidate division KSB1 bacterium]
MLFKKIFFIISILFMIGLTSSFGKELTERTICGDAFEGYTLFAPNNSKATYLIDMNGNIVYKWSHNRSGGYAVYLLDNGNILRTAQASNSYINGGGSQGYVQEVDRDGKVVWEFLYSSPTYLAHHDIEPMPNGNVLIIAWEVKSASEAKAAGRKTSSTVWSDHVIEVEKSTSQIVWQWHA